MAKVFNYPLAIRNVVDNLLKSPSIAIKITCFFWIITKFICFKLWFSSRFFPVVSAFEYLQNTPAIVHVFLFYSSILLMLLLLFFSDSKVLLSLLIIIEICGCFLDVLRLQPWEYQFIFILIIYLINKKNPLNLYSVYIFVFACIYIYSGLHKFNGGFLRTIWDNLLLKRFLGINRSSINIYRLHYLGLCIPVIETLTGIALLFFKNKKIPIVVLIGMHIFILFFLGPLGLHYNTVIWPWNILMICFLLLFAFNNCTLNLKPLFSGYNVIILTLWGLFPILSFVGLWDSYLSFSLYSGNLPHVDICVEQNHENKKLERYFSKTDKRNICNGDARIPINAWALNELNVPFYPANWYFIKFKKVWVEKYKTLDAKFLIYTYPYKNRKEIR